MMFLCLFSLSPVCGRAWSVFIQGVFCRQASQTCCDTPPFLEKDIPMMNFFFCFVGGGGGEGPERRKCRRDSFSKLKVPASNEVSQPSIALKIIGASKLETGLSAPVIGGCLFCHTVVVSSVPSPLKPRC